MSGEQPRFTLAVADVPAWLSFLTEQAGFQFVDAERAWLRTPRGALFALGAEGMRPNEVNYVHPDVASLMSRIPGAALAESSWGDRILTAPAPEGLALRFVQPAEHAPAETFRRYLAGVDELAAALDSLSDEDLDRPGPNDGWSIRRIVNHTAHQELLLAGQIRMALDEPGRQYVVTYGSRQADLADATRPLGPTLALLRAFRDYLRPIVEAIPDALERHTVDAAGNRMTVAQSLAACGRHLAEHVDEIRGARGAEAPRRSPT